jgi:hypothetical protein
LGYRQNSERRFIGNARAEALLFDSKAKLDSPIKKGRTSKLSTVIKKKPRVRHSFALRKLAPRPPDGMNRALQLKGKLLLFCILMFLYLFIYILIAERPNQFNAELGSEEVTASDNNQSLESSSGMFDFMCVFRAVSGGLWIGCDDGRACALVRGA